MLLLVGSSITAFVKSVADREVKTALPPEVAWSKVETFNSQVGGFLEGCQFGVYRITEQTAQKFAPDADPPGEWYPTPLKIEGGGPGRVYVVSKNRWESFFASYATNCADRKVSAEIRNYRPSLDAPGSWYKIINHGEGLILVDPTRRRAWYLYSG